MGVFIPQELANATNLDLSYCLVDSCCQFKKAKKERLLNKIKLKSVYCHFIVNSKRTK